MNNSLKILDIITNKNLDEDYLKLSILQNPAEHFAPKIAVLFRRYYGLYNLTTEDENENNPDILIKKIVKHKREKRFTENKYWSIWKEEGRFFGFIEGFFHAQEGKNQLCKIVGRKIDEDFLILKHEQRNLKETFNIENQIDYFKYPEVFAERFKTQEDLRVFLRINKIQRMVARRENAKGMHYNIFSAAIEIAKDYNLKNIFKHGINGDVKFFESKNKLEAEGLRLILSSFSGYGPKITKMVMNLVFDVPIVAVDRRVLKSAILLNLVQLNNVYIEKIKTKYGLENANFKQVTDKISSLSEKYPLTKTEEELNIMFHSSPFVSEADYLLFMYNGGDNWNFAEEESDVCKVGKCMFDEKGICKLRKKVEYEESFEMPSQVAVLRYNAK